MVNQESSPPSYMESHQDIFIDDDTQSPHIQPQTVDGHLHNQQHNESSLSELTQIPTLDTDYAVVIIPSDYPANVFNKESKTHLERVLCQELNIKNIPEKKFAPKFRDSQCKHGAIFISCSDEMSKQSLVVLIHRKPLFKGQQLKTCDPKDLILVAVVEFIIPKGEEFNEAIKNINERTENLNIKEWNLMGTTTFVKGTRVTFEIEEKILLKLKNTHMRIFYKLQTISVKILETYYKKKGDRSRYITPSLFNSDNNNVKSIVKNVSYDSKQCLRTANQDTPLTETSRMFPGIQPQTAEKMPLFPKVDGNSLTRNEENLQHQEMKKRNTTTIDLTTSEEVQMFPDGNLHNQQYNNYHEPTTLTRKSTNIPSRENKHVVVIIPSDYPATIFTEDNKIHLECAILQRINNMPESKFVSKFIRSQCKHGVIFISCSDEMSKQYLIHRTLLLKGMQMKTFDPEDLVLVSTVEFIIPKIEEFDEALKHINETNENLNVKEWTLVGVTHLLIGTRVIFEIDQKLLLKLQEAEMKIIHKLETISDIKILETYYKQKGDRSRHITPSLFNSDDHIINTKSAVTIFPYDSKHRLRMANQDSPLPGSSRIDKPEEIVIIDDTQFPDVQPQMAETMTLFPKVNGNRLTCNEENVQHQVIRKRKSTIDLMTSEEVQGLPHGRQTTLTQITKIPRTEPKHVVVVIPTKYPESTFNEESKLRLERSMSQHLNIKNTPEETFVRKFLDSKCKHGAVYIFCSDDRSKQSLIDLIHKKQLVKGIQLKTCNPEDLIQVAIVEFIIPKDESLKKSIDHLKELNENLNIKQWNLLSNINLIKGYHVIFEIEEKFLLKLKETNMKIMYPFHTISDIKILETYHRHKDDKSRRISTSLFKPSETINQSPIKNFPYDSKQSLKFAAYNICGLLYMKKGELFQFLMEHDVFFIFYNLSVKTYTNDKLFYHLVRDNLDQYDVRISSLDNPAEPNRSKWGYICGIHHKIQNNVTFKYIDDIHYILEVRDFNSTNNCYMLPINLNLNFWQEDFNYIKRIINRGKNFLFVLICDFNCKIGYSQVHKEFMTPSSSEYDPDRFLTYTRKIQPKFKALMKFLENNNLSVVKGPAWDEFQRGLKNDLKNSVVDFCAISKGIIKHVRSTIDWNYCSDHLPISVELATKSR